MKSNLYIDLHVIQTLPPSCVNRDDLGSPKSAIYGGVSRARVSSQAWKRAIRMYFQEHFPQEEPGIRTQKVVSMLAEKIAELGTKGGLEPQELAQTVLEKTGIGLTKREKGSVESSALTFTSESQIWGLARIAAEHPDGKGIDQKECIEAFNAKPPIDIALFGRMLAGEKALNFDAAAQVAHAISTHAVRNEYDFFVAIDDLDTSCAGYLGTHEFNSATIYRYANINASELARSIGIKQTAKAVSAFVDAFINSMPSGSKNSFANGTDPDAIYIAVRRDQPRSFVKAFEKPLKASQEGYSDRSVEALVSFAQKKYQTSFRKPEKEFAVGELLGALTDTTTVWDLLTDLESYIQSVMEEAE